MSRSNDRLVSIVLPEDLAKHVRAQAAATEATVTSIVLGMIQGTQAVPAARPTPDDAADILLGLLNDDHRRIIEECARDHRVRPLAFLLSALKLAYERGEAGRLLGEITLGVEISATTPFLDKPHPATTCAFCATVFTPTRPGQIYCPAPPDTADGDACSTKASKQELQRQLGERTFHIPAPA